MDLYERIGLIVLTVRVSRDLLTVTVQPDGHCQYVGSVQPGSVTARRAEHATEGGLRGPRDGGLAATTSGTMLVAVDSADIDGVLEARRDRRTPVARVGRVVGARRWPAVG